MPFRVWTRKNSMAETKTGSDGAPRGCACRRLRPLHLAGGRLRLGGRLEARVRDRREAAALHVELRVLGPAPGRGLHQGEHVERLDQLVVSLAHLDLAQLAL